MTDDRAMLQALIDATPAGGRCTLPAGTFGVGQAPTGYYGLHISTAITVEGDAAGTVLMQTDGIAASVRLVQIDGSGATLARITLDGNAAAQTADEHRAGAFVTAAGVTIQDVTAQHFTGDGLYAYVGADSLSVIDCTCVDNHRNGLTLSAGAGSCVYRGTFDRNGAQQIDSEPGAPWTVDGVTIADATIGCAPGQFAVTISGSGSASRSRGWRVTGCTIGGPVHVVWCDNVLIASNAIANSSDKAGVDVYRTCAGVTITRNTIACSRTDVANQAGVLVWGTGTGQAPSDVLIADNTITLAGAQAFGIRAQGCLSVAAVGNTIAGSGLAATTGAGVYLRATNTAVPVDLATVVGNTIVGFGNKGLSVAGNGAAQLTMLRAVGNAIGDATSITTIGMQLDDGQHALQHSDIAGNVYGSGVTAGRL